MKKQTLLHCPLEPYKSRYTELLSDWEVAAFSATFDVTTVEPKDNEHSVIIRSGKVLDRIGRPLWALKQIQQLLTVHSRPFAQDVYFSDFFHPGLESLPYAGFKGNLFSFCWAQSFDQFDFTRAEMMPWMRLFEFMALEVYRCVFVASTGLADLITSVIPSIESKIVVVGLPFNSAMVAAKADLSKCPGEEYHVVYSSRFDKEKNPSFFLDLVETRDDLKFCICTGDEALRGSDDKAVKRARALESKSKLRIFTGLEKAEYYAILTACAVQFNSAEQDWVSYTLLEALTFGCMPLYPNHRSFPETFEYDRKVLYRPRDLKDASNLLSDLLLSKERDYSNRTSILDTHDQALHRIAARIEQVNQ